MSGNDSESDYRTKSIFDNQRRTNRRPQLREEESFFYGGFNTNITIASDDSCLPPEAAKLKASYSRDLDYISGAVSFSTPRDSNKKEKFSDDNKDDYRCVVFPLAQFNNVFHNPKYFARLLNEKALKYIETWNRDVATKDPSKRSSFDTAYGLFEEERKIKGTSKIERAEMQMVLQSFLFTQEQSSVEHPKITLDNIR